VKLSASELKTMARIYFQVWSSQKLKSPQD
jgi:hypothetical protein